MGGGHSSVMHDGDRRAHHDGAGYLSPAGRRFFISEVKGDPKRGEGNQNGEHDGQEDEKGIIMGYSRHTHGGHADVMHARNTPTHQDTPGERSERTHFLSAHHVQRND